MSGTPWRACTAVACAAVCLSCASNRATGGEVASYRSLRGSLTLAETTFIGMRGRYATYRVRLASSTGLDASGRLLAPTRGSAPHPAVLLNDGRELDSHALDYLPREFGDAVVLSLDYPAQLPYEISIPQLLRHGERYRRAAREIPALFSLGASYLARRGDVDSTRLAIVATSFAVPFATIAAAADNRFRNVALIYGAGDFARVLAANLAIRPSLLRAAAAWLVTRPFAEFEPARFAHRISPRPLVMINGIDDPQMPRDAVRELYTAARAPKEIIWLRTGHLMPTDSALIGALVDTALARLPVLARTSTVSVGAGGRAEDASATSACTDRPRCPARRSP